MLVRAWVVDDRVTEISLRPNFHIMLRMDQKRPTQVEVDLSSFAYQNGDDGCIPLAGHVYLVAA